MRKKRYIAIGLLISSMSVHAQDAAAPALTYEGSMLSHASASSDKLTQIAQNTYNILTAVNNIPDYMNAITQQALSWLALEDTEGSYIMKTQGDFANLGNLLVQSTTNQNGLQQQAAAALYGFDVNDFVNPKDAPKVLETMPYVNEITYSSLLGAPPVARGPFDPANYLRNALGANIPHAAPSASWAGDTMYKITYAGYYKVLMAANSFGAYVLTGLIAENQTGNQLSPLHDKLITEASQSSWLAQIATEDLGKVLRDILLFQSQNYVLMTKSIQLQKQQLTAQVFTNSLLVATNLGFESELFKKATGMQK